MKYTVVRDTREHEGEGWTWKPSAYCAGTVIDTLHTGDYSLRGYEMVVVIERKGSISEWAQNINQPRIERELQRLELVKFPFFVMEFTLADIMNYPIGSNVPKYLWSKLKFKGPFLLKRTIELMMRYRTKFLFAGGSGREITSSIFKRAIEIIENVKDINNIAEPK